MSPSRPKCRKPRRKQRSEPAERRGFSEVQAIEYIALRVPGDQSRRSGVVSPSRRGRGAFRVRDRQSPRRGVVSPRPALHNGLRRRNDHQRPRRGVVSPRLLQQRVRRAVLRPSEPAEGRRSLRDEDASSIRRRIRSSRARGGASCLREHPDGAPLTSRMLPSEPAEGRCVSGPQHAHEPPVFGKPSAPAERRRVSEALAGFIQDLRLGAISARGEASCLRAYAPHCDVPRWGRDQSRRSGEVSPR